MQKLLLQKHISIYWHGRFENKDWSTNHPNLENDALKLKREALKTGKRSTQNSEMKHPKLETCLSF